MQVSLKLIRCHSLPKSDQTSLNKWYSMFGRKILPPVSPTQSSIMSGKPTKKRFPSQAWVNSQFKLYLQKLNVMVIPQSPEVGGESEDCSTYSILAGQKVSEMLKFLHTMHQAVQKMSKDRGKQSPVLQSVLTKA